MSGTNNRKLKYFCKFQQLTGKTPVMYTSITYGKPQGIILRSITYRAMRIFFPSIF